MKGNHGFRLILVVVKCMYAANVLKNGMTEHFHIYNALCVVKYMEYTICLKI